MYYGVIVKLKFSIEYHGTLFLFLLRSFSHGICYSCFCLSVCARFRVIYLTRTTVPLSVGHVHL